MSRWGLIVAVFWGALVVRIGGQAYVSSRLESQPDSLMAPLSTLPLDILGPEWKGDDLPLPEEVVEIADVAEYVHRRYEGLGHRVILYLGLVEGGAGGGLHHPSICLPAHGFEIEETQNVTIVREESPEDATFSEFRFQKPMEPPGYGLTTFYYNGGFRPEKWRLQLTDRWPGIKSYVIITLLGDALDTNDATQDLYTELMRKVLHALRPHLPGLPAGEADAHPVSGEQLKE